VKALTDGSKSRKKTRHQWFELQDTCAYHAEFAKEKLLWMHMSERGRFAYDTSNTCCNQKGFIMTGTSLKYLCAILNSSLITWATKSNAVTTGMGLTQWDKFTVERLPIPRIPAAKQRPFIRLIESILSNKVADPATDTIEQEEKIDRLVYALYGLTSREIAVLESVLQN